MRKLHLIFVAIGLLFSVGNVGAQSTPPDQILVNGKVVTVDDAFSIAEAIAVRGNRIVAVGSNAEIRRLAGSGTKVVDVSGKTVISGLMTTTFTCDDGDPLARSRIISRAFRREVTPSNRTS